ncbi:MAG: hypothetical protein U1E93_12750 [Alphaproteobacteria bacterium]
MHQQGRLAEAEPVYRQMLAAAPGDFTAQHMLGVLKASRASWTRPRC